MPSPQQAMAPVETQLRQACAELESRLLDGEDLRAESILARFPAVAADEEAALDLIYSEFVVRQRRGEHPAETDWYRRFPEKQEQLRRLFRFHALLAADLSSPSTNVSRHTPPGFPQAFQAPPGRLGQYELFEEIGRGGMGVVYRARQRGLERSVALKLILSGELAAPEEVARFRTEALAAASLQHPNLIQVYEVGEDQGQHFLALEFVDGPSLEKHLAATPAALDETVQLVETLSHAMHHAHERGIIHRDLKPANILLSQSSGAGDWGVETENQGLQQSGPANPPNCSRPLSQASIYHSQSLIPKITDFGLAKRFQAEGGPTHTNALVGTPSYMAPEQTQQGKGEISPATDVYALGAVLYECLTGRPPFKGESAVDTLLQVRNREPVAPRQLRPNLPRDLETICLKCLAKEPQRRYRSALALAEDLARWRDGRPILARPTPVWERALKWVRRHPAVAGLIAVSVAAVAILAAGLLWRTQEQARELAQTQFEWERAEASLRIARAEWDRAETNLRTGGQLVDGFLEHLGTTGITHIPGLDLLVNNLLEQALHFRKGFLHQRGDDPALREQVARAYQQVSYLQLLLGRQEEADRTLSESVAYYEKLMEEHPEDRDYKQRLTASLHNRADVLLKLPGRAKEATALLQRAIETQKSLANADTAERRYRLDLARHYHGMGGLFHQQKEFPTAEQYYRLALDLRKQLLREDAESPDFQYQVALSYLEMARLRRELADHQRSRERLKEADAQYEEALRLLEPLTLRPPTRPEFREALGRALTNRGNLLKDLQSPLALGSYLRALELRTRLAEDYRERPLYRHQLAITLLQLGDLYFKSGKIAEGERSLREGLKYRLALADIYTKMVDNHNELGKTAHLLADLLHRRGRAAEAWPLVQLAVTHQKLAVQASPRQDWADLLTRHSRFQRVLLERALLRTTGI